MAQRQEVSRGAKLYLVAVAELRRRTISAAISLRLFVFSVLLFLVPCKEFASQAESEQLTGLEEPATLALQGLSGDRQSLEHYRDRIVILNFWATWCVPCREEMPLFGRVREDYRARGVEIIGAAADDASTRDQVEAFIEEYGINFPIWLGATAKDMERLGLGTTLPATALIDRDGHIVARILGLVEERELIERIDWLLGDRTAQPPPPRVDHLESAKDEHGHHEGEEEHQHAAVAMEGASLVPS